MLVLCFFLNESYCTYSPWGIGYSVPVWRTVCLEINKYLQIITYSSTTGSNKIENVKTIKFYIIFRYSKEIKLLTLSRDRRKRKKKWYETKLIIWFPSSMQILKDLFTIIQYLIQYCCCTRVWHYCYSEHSTCCKIVDIL